MITIRKLSATQFAYENLADFVIALDHANMQPIFEKAGIPFPEDKRREGFAKSWFIMAFSGSELAGYVDFCPSFENPLDLYISSLQIDKRWQKSGLLRRLLAEAIRDLRLHDFTRFVSAVQKENDLAIKIYRRLGFSFQERSVRSFAISANRSILYGPVAQRLLGSCHTVQE